MNTKSVTKKKMSWFVYITECKDNSLYTGITKNLKRRISEHNDDNIKGAKSLRSKRPVKLVYFEEYRDQQEAARRESAIKKWQKKYKLLLISKGRISNKGSPLKITK